MATYPNHTQKVQVCAIANTTSSPALYCGAPKVQVLGLLVGQPAGTIDRKHGLSYDCFYTGEAVCIPRSDGRRTIAQVSSVSAGGMVVNAGGGVAKFYNPQEIVTHVRKLMGVYTVNGEI